MSKKSAPQTTGADKVTFSNYVLQFGERCDYTDFRPVPLLRDYILPLARPGIHEIEAWALGTPLNLEVRRPVGSYQYAFLCYEHQCVAAMHAGFDASGGRQAWGAAQTLNQISIYEIRAKASKEVADEAALFMRSHPELVAPTGSAMVSSLLPVADPRARIDLALFEGFTRQLFWALCVRRAACTNGSA